MTDEQERADFEAWLGVKPCCGAGHGTCAMYAINLPEAINGWPEPGQIAEFCEAAIDHARRIEGDS